MKPRAAGLLFLVAAAAICLVLGPRAAAQQAQLRVVVVAGQDALNNIRLNENQNVIVEVQDENRMPVMGAEVTFILPNQGASGTFADGGRMLAVTTDVQGRAVASGIHPNDQTGPMQIRVSASYIGLTATAVIAQTNVAVAVVEPPKPAPPPAPAAAPQTTPAPQTPEAAPQTTSAGAGNQGRGMSKGAKVFLVIAIAAGAAAGAVFATRSNDSGGGGGGTPGTPGIVITPGTPTVGGPQ